MVCKHGDFLKTRWRKSVELYRGVRVCGWVWVCVQLCLHTVDMQGHESGSNKPGVEMSRASAKNAWMGSVQTIVLPSETAAIYRIWKGRDGGNKSLPVCWEPLGSGEKPEREKKHCLKGSKNNASPCTDFSCLHFWEDACTVYVVSNAFLVNGLVYNNLLSDNALI